MTTPRFSVVIPTREGAQTLPYTLRTCLEQSFDNFEVLVCDNWGSSAVQEVLAQFDSPRLRVLRTDRLLSMSSNWEFAVAQARGEFITVLGDDDGLLPHALAQLDQLLRQTHARVIRWGAAFYTWPTVVIAKEANYLRLPLKAQQPLFREVSGREMMASVIQFNSCYTTLPMIYNSVVHREVLEETRRRAGKIFLTRYPDVCSGFVLAQVAERYLSVDVPFSVAGVSHKSVGFWFCQGIQQSEIGQEFLRLHNDEGIQVPRLVPDLRIFPVIPVADCFLATKQALFPNDNLSLDRQTLLQHCVWCLRTDTQEHWDECMRVLRDSLTDDPTLTDWFDQNLAHFPANTSGALPLRSAFLGYDGSTLHLDTSAFGVTDVFGAARLCGQLLGNQERRLLELPAQVSLSPSEIELREKEDMIQQLATAAEDRLRLIEELSHMADYWRRRAERVERELYRRPCTELFGERGADERLSA